MKVLIAGDYCPIGRINDKINSGDYSSVFGRIRPIIKDADYSIVNFECSVASFDDKPIEKQGPNLKCSPKGVEALQWSGFKCVTLANNHFLDYGPSSVRKTLEVLDSYGIDYVGGGMSIQDASAILYKEINGRKLAIINCCEHEFSIASDYGAGSNPLDPIKQYYAIIDAKKKADYVLVIVHGGHEHFQLPSIRMLDTYRFFVDAGADAVVNHHQHCFSGYEIWHEKPIFFGLGNFCFDNDYNRKGLWTEGYCVEIDFTDKKPAFVLYPYNQCAQKPTIELLESHAFKNRIDELNDIINDPAKLKEAVDRYYDLNSKHYAMIFEPLFNRIYLAARYRGWLPSLIGRKRKLAARNFVRCESHRDVLFKLLDSQ